MKYANRDAKSCLQQGWGVTVKRLAVIIFAMVAYGCQPTSPPTPTPKSATQIEKEQREEQLRRKQVEQETMRKARLEAERRKALAAQQSEEKAELKRLLTRFNKKTSFHNNVSFEHKDQDSIAVIVGGDGTRLLNSIYSGDSWIFHNKITVKIHDPDIFLESPVVDPLSKAVQRVSSGSVIVEVVQYPDDAGIIQKIAKNTGKTIGVLFEGGTEHEETLSADSKKAIRDCQRLSELLTKFPIIK